MICHLGEEICPGKLIGEQCVFIVKSATVNNGPSVSILEAQQDKRLGWAEGLPLSVEHSCSFAVHKRRLAGCRTVAAVQWFSLLPATWQYAPACGGQDTLEGRSPSYAGHRSQAQQWEMTVKGST